MDNTGSIEDHNKKRLEAIDSLVKSYKQKYNHGSNDAAKDPFYIHPNLAFVASGTNGLAVRVSKSVREGSVLLKIPDAARLTISNIEAASSSVELSGVLKDIKARYYKLAAHKVSEFGSLEQLYSYGDICLAVAIMYAFAQDELYTKTWPSVQDFRKYCYPVWDPKDQVKELLEGTYTLHVLGRHSKGLRYAFNEIVKPILMQRDRRSDFLPVSWIERQQNDSDEETLWEAFQYARSLIRTRSHDGDDPDEPEIIPIIDLINGYPSYLAHQINAEAEYKYVGTKSMTKRSTAIVATQNIQENQEVIISYGDIKASECLLIYAFCPKEVLDHTEASFDNMLINMPVSTLGPPDALRTEACRKCFFPTTPEEIERGFYVLIRPESMPMYQRGGECDDFENLRQYLTLCRLLDDDGVKLNMATGRLRGQIPLRQIAQVLLLAVDHHVKHSTTLDASTNEQDLKYASELSRSDVLVAAYHVRVCQRDTYAQWRHAVCLRYMQASEHVESPVFYEKYLQQSNNVEEYHPDLPRPTAPKCFLASRGCRVCGRTINLKRCSKCKLVWYCGREHQVLDWKHGHKKQCSPSTGSV